MILDIVTVAINIVVILVIFVVLVVVLSYISNNKVNSNMQHVAKNAGIIMVIWSRITRMDIPI